MGGLQTLMINFDGPSLVSGGGGAADGRTSILHGKIKYTSLSSGLHPQQVRNTVDCNTGEACAYRMNTKMLPKGDNQRVYVPAWLMAFCFRQR